MDTTTSNVSYIQSWIEFEELINSPSNKLVVVDFTAKWCGPCKHISPVLDQMASSNTYVSNHVMFVKVDVDDAQEISRRCQIQSMPTFQFYKKGRLVQKFSGADVAKLKSVLSDLMNDDSSRCCSNHEDKSCGIESKVNSGLEDNNQEKLSVPEGVVMRFFKECTSALNLYQYDRDSSTNESTLIPLTLDQHKARILSLQMKVLEDLVKLLRSKNKLDDSVSVDALSIALRQVGRLGSEYNALKVAAEEFNASARLALARAVLVAERKWRQNGSPNIRDFIDKDSYSKSTMRTGFKEFFGLASAAVELPEIKKELKSTEEPLLEESTRSLIPLITEDLESLSLPRAQKKLVCLQRVCFNAVNFDHSFATSVLNKLPENYPDDQELIHLFRNFLDAMTSAVTNATCSSLNDEATGTRVVDVKYKTVNDSGAPSNEKMSHQMSFEQKKQLAMARKATELQQTVMAGK